MFRGVNTTADEKDITDDQCREMANMEMSSVGELQKRAGFTKDNSTSLGSSISGLFGYLREGASSRQVIASEGTEMNTL